MAATALVAALAPAGAGAQGTVPGCTPADNVEAMIDDSASMAFRDFHGLRRTGFELFTHIGANARKTLGAVEFGSRAETLFAPQPIVTGRTAMIQALRARIRADNGGTDYDEAFLKATADNPSAQARIFLTDSPHEGIYRESHRGGAPTYVVGLRIGAADPSAGRLQQIAAESGGLYLPAATSADLQPALGSISTAIGCLPPPRTSTSGLFTRTGQRSTRTVALASTTSRIDLVLSWTRQNNGFGFVTVEALGRRNRVIADLSGRGRPAKLRVRRALGAGFQTLTVGRPRGARKLRYRIGALRFFARERAITQLIQRAR